MTAQKQSGGKMSAITLRHVELFLLIVRKCQHLRAPCSFRETKRKKPKFRKHQQYDTCAANTHIKPSSDNLVCLSVSRITCSTQLCDPITQWVTCFHQQMHSYEESRAFILQKMCDTPQQAANACFLIVHASGMTLSI